MTARIIDAAEALRMGIATNVTPADRFEAACIDTLTVSPAMHR